MTTSPIKMNGVRGCPLCHSDIAAGGWGAADDRNLKRYMGYHMKRCEVSSEEDRAYYREHGSWPRKVRSKKKS